MYNNRIDSFVGEKDGISHKRTQAYNLSTQPEDQSMNGYLLIEERTKQT